MGKVQSDYNFIANSFSNKRNYIWPDLDFLKRFFSEGNRVLDLGCGNGRLLALFKDSNIDYTGVDISEKLIQKAKEKYPDKEFRKADALGLPFENQSFDKILSVAVFHHIPSEEYRIRFLKEAKRVLRPNGLLILTVWNLYPFLCQGKLLNLKFLKYHLKYFFLKLLGRSRLDFRDIFYPWKSQEGKILVQRYVHCFTREELAKLARRAGFLIKKQGFLKGKRNLFMVLEL